jgi:hypothetical protein
MNNRELTLQILIYSDLKMLMTTLVYKILFQLTSHFNLWQLLEDFYIVIIDLDVIDVLPNGGEDGVGNI